MGGVGKITGSEGLFVAPAHRTAAALRGTRQLTSPISLHFTFSLLLLVWHLVASDAEDLF
jgi:hypothetical protein